MAGLSQPPGGEPHVRNGLAGRLNRLRAGVLGANDGIVSVAAIAVGVAGATSSTRTILTPAWLPWSAVGSPWLSVSTSR